MCYSCFCETGYCCILSSHSFSNRCSIIEKNESVPGWVMGNSAAYCKVCDEKSKQTASNTSWIAPDDTLCISLPEDKHNNSEKKMIVLLQIL